MEVMAASRAGSTTLSRSALAPVAATEAAAAATSSAATTPMSGISCSGFCGVRIRAGGRADCSSSGVGFRARGGSSRRSKGLATVQAGFGVQVDGFRRDDGEQQRPTVPRLQDLDPNTVLQRQRILFLGGQVDDSSADLLIGQMLLLDALDPTRDIKLFINSPGGSVTAGMGIYDAMKLCRADVSTTCFGLAASMGAFLLAAGSKGKRYCMPNARVMIHQPLGGAQGSAIEIGLQVREMMYHKKKLGKIMARLTGQTEEQIDIDTDRDNFMNAWEAKAYGLVDHVVDDGKPGLVAPLGEVKEPPRSKVWDFWTVKEGTERKKLPTEQEDFHGGRRFGDRQEDEVEEGSKEQEKAAV